MKTSAKVRPSQILRTAEDLAEKFGLARADTPLAIGSLPEGSRVLIVEFGEIRSGLITVEEVEYDNYVTKHVMLNNEQVYGHYYPLNPAGGIYAEGPNLILRKDAVLFCAESSEEITDAEDQTMATGRELANELDAQRATLTDLSELTTGSQLIMVRADGITAGDVRVFSEYPVGNLDSSSVWLAGRFVQTVNRRLDTGVVDSQARDADYTEFYV